MVVAGSVFALGLAALIVLVLRRLISPTRFAQAAAGLALGAALVALVAQEVRHG